MLFSFALIVALVGVGAFAVYNPGAHDITIQSYHFAGVPDWIPVAVGAAVPLALFLLDAIFAQIHMQELSDARASSQRGPGGRAASVRRQPDRKRSWTVSRD